MFEFLKKKKNNEIVSFDSPKRKKMTSKQKMMFASLFVIVTFGVWLAFQLPSKNSVREVSFSDYAKARAMTYYARGNVEGRRVNEYVLLIGALGCNPFPQIIQIKSTTNCKIVPPRNGDYLAELTPTELSILYSNNFFGFMKKN